MAKPLSRPEINGLVEDLIGMLAAIESGDLEGSAALRHRIEGAITALHAVLGKQLSRDLLDMEQRENMST